MAAKRHRMPGKKVSQLWFTPEDYALVKAAAKIDRRPLATFALLATVKAAKLLMIHQKCPGFAPPAE